MPLTRRSFLAGCAAPVLAQQSASQESRPNIILIVADDLADWMLGCYGNREIRTPNIDELARAGTRFQNNFVCSPICSASRATLFTGRVPRQHGIHDFLTPNPIADPPQGQKEPPSSFRDEIMISDVLAGAGYNCGYVGKWHMGNDATPQHAYKYWYAMLGGSSPYQNPRMNWNGTSVEEKGYLPDLITRKSVEFIEQQKADRPFFLVTSHFNPHVPYDGHPQKYYDMYANTKFETIGWEPAAPNALREKEYLNDIVGNLRKCAASVTALDDQVPPLIAALTRKKLRGNTIVIFTGDNGLLLGRHGLWSKGLASNPINMYEEVVRTPMIWSWLGQIPIEGRRPEMVNFCDVLPSICEIAGAPAPTGRNLPGRSYAPLLFNRPLPKKQPWRNMVFGQLRNTEMVRDPRFKLVLRDEGASPSELFDLTADPREKVNLYENPQYVTVRDRLTKELENWRKKYA